MNKKKHHGSQAYPVIFKLEYLKIVLLLFPLFLEVPMLMPVLNSYLKLTLVWSASFLIYDFFHHRYFLKGRGKWLLCFFLLTYFMSVLLNYKTSFRMNAISYAYVVSQSMILTIPTENPRESLEKVSSYVYKIGMVFSTLGVFLYLAQIENALFFNGKFYPIGFYSSRLVGLYRNITSPSLGYITLFTLYYLLSQKRQNKKIPVLAYYAFFINFIHLLLSNSKGVLIGTRVFLVVFIGLSLFLKLDKKPFIKKITMIASVLIVSLVLYEFTLNTSQKLLSYAPSHFSEIYQFRSNIEDPDYEIVEGPVDLDREVSEHYDKLTGRPSLWKQGLEAFMEKPLFGHGAYSNAGKIGFDFSEQRFTTYHNSYIHTLFSAGIFGFASLFSYFLVLVFIAIQNLQKISYLDSLEKMTFVFTLGILAMSAVIAMGETNLLFMNRFHEYVFWYYVGILISYDIKLNNKGVSEI